MEVLQEVFVERIGRNVPRPSGTALISGLVQSSDRTDQLAFDVIHKHDCFDKIIAYSPSNSFAKKRLIGRSSRYTGLLDVLDFSEGTEEHLISKDGPLTGVDSWLAFESDASSVLAKAQAAKDAGVKHLVIMVEGNADFGPVEALLKDTDVTYSLITLGGIEEGKESMVMCSYNFTDSSQLGTVNRDDAVRVAAESIVIPNASNVAFGIKKADGPGVDFIKTVIREKGRSRQQEIAQLIIGGDETIQKHEDAKAERRAQAEERKRLREEELAKSRDDRPYKVRQKERQEENLVYEATTRCFDNYERQILFNFSNVIKDKQEYMDKFLNITIDELRGYAKFDDFNEVMYEDSVFELSYEREQTELEIEWDRERLMSDDDDDEEADKGKKKAYVPTFTDDDRIPGVYEPVDPGPPQEDAQDTEKDE